MKARTVKHRQDSDKMIPKESPEVFFKVTPKARALRNQEPISDQIACSKICTKNYKWMGAQEDFPLTPHHRHVDKFYPFAMQGKGLLIDEPMIDDTIKFCEEVKRPMLEKRGLRYLVIRKETTIEELLEEIAKWHGPRS